MIHVIITGGTIDSFWDQKQGKLSPNRHSAVMPSMKDIFSDYVFAFDVLCLKDARDISETNLQQLVSLVQKTLSDNILVVHGFQTMADSMDVVNNSLGYHKKKILFVGSRFPLHINKGAARNQLSGALKSFSTSKKGVRAAIDGQLLDATRVRQWRYDRKLDSEWVI